MTSALPTTPTEPLAMIAAEIRSWSPSLKVGTAIMVVILFGAIFAPWVAPYDPYFQDFAAALQPPGVAHFFGTDSLGRDIFSRVIYGARIDLQIGLVTTYVPMSSGMLLGAYSGYIGGCLGISDQPHHLAALAAQCDQFLDRLLYVVFRPQYPARLRFERSRAWHP